MPVQPSCFGKSWDPSQAECKGGLDPLYSNPTNGSKLRDKCSWFGPCSQQTQRLREQAQSMPPQPPQPPLIPATSLLQRAVNATAPMRMQPTSMGHIPPPSPPRPPTYSGAMTQYSMPVVTPTMHAPPPAPPMQHMQHAQQPQMYQQVMPQNFAPAHMAQHGAQFIPMPYQHPGSQMPQYLTIPEPSNDNVHWALRLLRELARSMVKAFGHQLAAHVDSHSIQKHLGP